ncbi:MAG: hypothetical protein ACO307_03220 [Ilumatobacteraceae bacterium]
MNRWSVVPYQGEQVTVVPLDVAETGVIDLIGTTPGPAGMASVDLGDVVVSVDFAVPRRLVGIESTRTGSPADDPILVSLLGDETALGLETVLRDDPNRSATRRIGGDPTTGRRRDLSFDPRGRAAADFGLVVVGLAVADDDVEHPLVRAVAAVESIGALLERMGGTGPIDPRLLDSRLRRATEQLARDAEGDAVLRELDPDDYRAFHSGVEVIARFVRAGGAGDELGSDWLDGLLRAVPPRWFDLDDERRRRRPDPPPAVPTRRLASSGGGRAVMSPRPRAASPFGGGRPIPPPPLRLETVAAPPPIEPPLITMTSPGRLRVVYTSSPEGTWLRILDRSSLGVLAVVPVRDQPRRWVAEAVVPPDLHVEDLVVVVTDHPVTDAAASSIDRVLEAIEAGRRATMLTARRGLKSGGRAWSECAEAWAATGDETRANVARAYASGNDALERPWQVHDTVRNLTDD